MLNFETDREEFLRSMHSGAPFEMDEESWYYWLEVLPPVYMSRDVQLPNGDRVHASFGFAEGYDQITAFWKKGGRYYGCRTEQIVTYQGIL